MEKRQKQKTKKDVKYYGCEDMIVDFNLETTTAKETPTEMWKLYVWKGVVCLSAASVTCVDM